MKKFKNLKYKITLYLIKIFNRKKYDRIMFEKRAFEHFAMELENMMWTSSSTPIYYIVTPRLKKSDQEFNNPTTPQSKPNTDNQ